MPLFDKKINYFSYKYRNFGIFESDMLNIAT